MRFVVTALAVLCLASGGSAVAKPSGGTHAARASTAPKSPSSHVSKSGAKPVSPRSSIAPSTRTLRTTSTNASATSAQRKSSSKAQGVQRDTKGHIARDPAQKAKFEKSHPCPSTGKNSGACPDYVVDHVRPLKRGGADRPENMQWQTKATAKQKDKTE